MFARPLTLAAVLLVSLSLPLRAQQQPSSVKVAFVDTRELMKVAPGRVEAEALFATEYEAMKKVAQAMTDSVAAAQREFDKIAPTLTATQVKDRQQLLAALQGRAQNTFRALDQRAADRRAAILQPVLDKVRFAVEDVRREGGYSFIFDIDPANTLVVAQDARADVTPMVIAKLRASAATAKPDLF